MTLKATIEIAINVESVLVRKMIKQGYIRYGISLSYYNNSCKNFCHPYNIMRNGSQKPKLSQDIESQIDSYCEYFYSPSIFVNYYDDSYFQNQTCYFKAYIDVEKIDKLNLMCQAVLLFSEDNLTEYRLLCSYSSKILKVYSISAYLPIVFDDLGGFQISGTYHATVIEFKFQKVEGDNAQQYDDFKSYVTSITNGFNYAAIRKFYNYYRQIIQEEYINLQQRYQHFKNLIKKKSLNTPINWVSNKIILDTHNKLCQLSPNIELLSKIQQLSQNTNVTARTNLETAISDFILKDFTILKAYMYHKWNDYNKFILENSKLITERMREEYEQLVRDKFRNNIFSHIIKNHDHTVSKYDDSGKSHIQYAIKQKLKYEGNQQLWRESFPIHDFKFLGNDSTNIKIFEEIFYPSNQVLQPRNSIDNKTSFNKSPRKNGKNHLIVLVHGFQASRADFLLLKSCLQIHYDVQILISACNQGRTDQSLDCLGKRLAIQVSSYLSTLDKKYRISFIGHSMGGLIIRSALQLYCYISMCTPHLGYLYQTSKLIQAGLWVLSSWQKCPSISQLCLNDNEILKQCYLYKLSKKNTLNKFKKIALISSSQDEYVPYESARIEKNMRLLNGLNSAQTEMAICDMVDGILKHIQVEQLSRMNVIFNISKSNFDTFIGRTGHVLFLSDSQFIKQFVICFRKYFE